jgi:hypothetical protein
LIGELIGKESNFFFMDEGLHQFPMLLYSAKPLGKDQIGCVCRFGAIRLPEITSVRDR